MAAQVAPFTVRLPLPKADVQASNQAQPPVPPSPAQNLTRQQPTPNNNANLTDQHILVMIPASYRTESNDLVPPRLDDVSWIENELDTHRLHRIKRWYGDCGPAHAAAPASPPSSPWSRGFRHGTDGHAPCLGKRAHVSQTATALPPGTRILD